MILRVRRLRCAGSSAGGEAVFLEATRAGMGRWNIHRAPCPFLTGSFHRVIVVDASPLPVTAGAGDLIGGALNLASHAAVRSALSGGPDQSRQTGHVRPRHRGPGQSIILRVVALPVEPEAQVK